MARERSASSGGIIAKAGGGQSGATLLNAQRFNQVGTVGTAADSVMLPPAVNGMSCDCVNATANSLNVFPSSNETINALAANTALAVAAGKAFHAFCPVDGKWYIILSA
jgi:hypothetical protein